MDRAQGRPPQLNLAAVPSDPGGTASPSSRPVTGAGGSAGPGSPTGRPSPDPLRFERVGQAMRIDNWTLTVIDALHDEGVRPLLLKGPAVAEWLYGGDRVARSYNDADLIVAPDDLDAARSVLRHLGFSCATPLSMVVPGTPLRHAECWFRGRDHAAVDLHRSLHSTGHLAAEQVWRVVAHDAVHIEVHGSPVEVPSEAVRALHVVLHVRPKDHPGTQAWGDLQQAIAVLDDDTWRAARDVAIELDVEGEMGALLRLLPEGVAIADRLDLPTEVPRYLVLEHDSAPSSTRFLATVRSVGPAKGAQLLVRKLFPSADYVRHGWPIARRGPVFLAGAYVWRWLLAPVRLVEWARFRTSARSERLRER